MADLMCSSAAVVTEKYALSDLVRLADGEQYAALKKTFLASGKGRRPSLPQIIINNKLLLQLYILKETNGKSWEQLESWFSQIKEGFTVRPVVEKVLRQLNDQTRTELDVTVFLSQILDMDFISSSLSTYGVTRITLHQPPQVPMVQSEGVPNLFVIDFYKFCVVKTNDNETIELLYKWLSLFYCSLEKSLLKKKVDCILKKDKKLKKFSHRHPELYEEFINSIFLVTEEPKVKPSSSNENTVLNSQLAKALEELKKSNENMEKLITDKSLLLNKLSDKDTEISDLCSKLHDSDKKNLEITQLKSKLKESALTIKSCSNRLKSEKYQSKKTIEAMLHDHELEMKNLNLIVDNQKLEILNLKGKMKFLKYNAESLLNQNISCGCERPASIKDQINNCYSPAVRQTVISLISDVGVSAQNCAKCINIVAENLFGHRFDQLPSLQTCINICSEANVIGQVQAMENILSCDKMTVHTDGTSRDHQKIVGHQLTLDNGTVVHLGYNPVATEDANTMLDVTINLFQSWPIYMPYIVMSPHWKF